MCAPPPLDPCLVGVYYFHPQTHVVYLDIFRLWPPFKEHVSVHGKPYVKIWHVRLGVQIICTQ